jgi:hypothetical protein
MTEIAGSGSISKFHGSATLPLRKAFFSIKVPIGHLSAFIKKIFFEKKSLLFYNFYRFSMHLCCCFSEAMVLKCPPQLL